jgi:hypothetical protein
MSKLLTGTAIGAFIGGIAAPIALMIFRISVEGSSGFASNPIGFFIATIVYGGFCLTIPGIFLGAFLGLSISASATRDHKISK